MWTNAEFTDRLRPVLAAVQTPAVPSRLPRLRGQRLAVPFVTISRQAGIDAGSLAHQLVERLNGIDPGASAHPWTCWDRELVEKVAEDENISRPLLDSLEDESHSWLQEFFAGLSVRGDDHDRAYFRVVRAIRALAGVGRVVIVGRGGVHITHSMAGGIHVQLVAPLPWRVDALAARDQLTHLQATARLQEIDRNREAFFRTHWSREQWRPELFTATLNAATVQERALVDCIAALAKPAMESLAQQPTAASMIAGGI